MDSGKYQQKVEDEVNTLVRWSKGTCVKGQEGLFLSVRALVLIGFLASAIGQGGVLPRAEGAPPEIEHLHALALDPQTNTLFMGTHHGLYTSPDEGKTWKKVEAGGTLKGVDIMTIVMDPTNPQIMYIGTHQKGVLKSLDGGRTWEESNTGLRGRDVHALSIHPTDKRLHAWVVDKGLYRSMDGGATWKREDDGPPTDIKAMAAVNLPSGRGGIYLYAGTSDGLYRNPDCF